MQIPDIPIRGSVILASVRMATQAYRPRPVTSLTITTITTITKTIWIRPPPTWNENPRSHNISRMTAIVQSIALTLLFETRFVQAIYSDVTAGQGYADALGTYRRERREFTQKVAKEAKISIEGLARMALS
jgi:hypothetical protein